ncbi:CitMHS family transporter [Ureibacillus aquaedulcis]|uniref:Citrate:proton symporter n=1 Tax=Ureibacillus aquaedulcis TaxID=3058421 RepID=A0ABT8GW44_9BACL|nr:citrate:proton symporter [Ureibacillus sp. BA0131]MDN4495604.1 citrate:proton symporter [Ureibacillus sp. BA0131]
MLTFLGFLMIVVFMYLIMSNKMSALNALILVPAIFALFAGFTDVGDMIISGAEQVAATAIMVTFAILYFGTLIDAGMFDPLVNKVIKIAKGDPLKITVGTAVLSLLVGLDGDGTITYLIVVTAFLPLYDRLGMNKLILACLPAMSMGIMNVLPWGGPTARVMSVFNYDAMTVLGPLIPSIIAAAVYVVGLGIFFGLKERKRLGIYKETIDPQAALETAAIVMDESPQSLKRPKLFWFNLSITILLVIGLLTAALPLPVLFMLGFVIVTIVNYPNLKDQKTRLEAHAGNVLTVVSLIFAGGAFAGILEGTGMVDAIASSIVKVIPDFLAPQLPLLVGLTSMPFTFFMANDPYYFGIVPILAESASQIGIDKLEIAQASLLGQPLHLLSPLVGSVYVLIGLVGVNFRDHIKFSVKYAVGISIVMIVVAIITGALSI